MAKQHSGEIRKVSPSSSIVFWLGLIVMAVVCVVFGTVLFQSWQLDNAELATDDPIVESPVDAPLDPANSIAVQEVRDPPLGEDMKAVASPQRLDSQVAVPSPLDPDDQKRSETDNEISLGDSNQPLSALEPLEVSGVQIDDAPLQRNVTVAGDVIEEAFWAQPDADRGASQISFVLDGKFDRLQGLAVIADPQGGGVVPPAAVFRIYGDGNLIWESPALTAYGEVESVDADVADVMVLALVCESDAPTQFSPLAWARLTLEK